MQKIEKPAVAVIHVHVHDLHDSVALTKAATMQSSKFESEL